MKLRVEIDMDNAAFDDGSGNEIGWHMECNRILRELANALICNESVGIRPDGYTMFDVNGNRVGKAEVVE